MKYKLFSIIFATVLVLVGCKGNNTQEGTRDRTDGTIQQTRYDDNFNRNNRMNEGIRDNRQLNDGHSNDHMTNNRNNNRYDVSKEAADRITNEINEVERAYVLTTNNNAYVAVVIDNDTNTNDNNNKRDNTRLNQNTGMQNNDYDDDITEDMKRRISDIVRSVDNNIDNVYVSSNPDFIDLSNNYINDLNEGRPIKGMFDQIGEMIERVFPQNRR